jgi:uncharacterized protein YdeI (YjbR/CyaY-like superfamily)
MPIAFQAVLETLQAEQSWTAVWLPFELSELDPTGAWPVDGKLRVKGSICAAATPQKAASFATSLIRSKTRGCFLLVTAKMRKSTGLNPGVLAQITLEPDLELRAATPPPELAKLLKADRAVRKWFEALNYSTRKYIADMVSEPKSAEARQRRAEQWMERLLLTMDGEESPPPILQIAFRRQPLARTGWYALTANQRRTTLLHLFSCVSPEAQAKRVERILADAMQAARRSEKRQPADED